MIKKCVLVIMATSFDESFIQMSINDFIHKGFSNYKVTTNEIGNGTLVIITFATTYESSFIKERLLDTNFPFFFMINVMDSDDNFDYYFGEDMLIDDLEDINEGLIFTKHVNSLYSDKLSYGELPNIDFFMTTTALENFQYVSDLKVNKEDTKEYTLDELIDIIDEIGVENLNERQKECLKKHNDKFND